MKESNNFDICWQSQSPDKIEQFLREKLLAARKLLGHERHHVSELLSQLARAESAQGKLTEARTSLDEAELILNELQSSYPVRAKISLLLEQGRLFILLKTPSQARTRFSQAWTLSVNAKEDFFTIALAQMMAMIEPQKQQEDWINKAIEIAEQSTQEDARHWLGELYGNLGWRLFDLRRYEDSLTAHQSSLQNFQKHGTPQEVYFATWAIGRLLRQLGRVTEALAWNETLLFEKEAEAPSNGRLYEEIAECLQNLKRTEEAQRYFARAYRELSAEGRVVDRHPLHLKRLKELGKVSEPYSTQPK